MDNDFGTDEELDAECRLVGTMLRGIDPHSRLEEPLPPIAFCTAFHAAAYYAVLCLRACGKDATPDAVWRVVRVHEEADTFGIAQLQELSELAANSATFYDDRAILLMRAAGRCLGIAAAHGPTGSMH